MAEKFFIVFGQAESPQRFLPKEQRKHGAEGEVLEAAQEGFFVQVEAGTKKEARETVLEKYGTDVTQTPVVVKAINWETT